MTGTVFVTDFQIFTLLIQQPLEIIAHMRSNSILKTRESHVKMPLLPEAYRE